jgi:hypothetical protein
MIDIIDRIEDARITVSARARDASDAEVYAVLVDAAKEIERLRGKCDELEYGYAEAWAKSQKQPVVKYLGTLDDE